MQRLRVAERLEQRVGLQQLALQVAGGREAAAAAANTARARASTRGELTAARGDQVLEQPARRLGLAGARLARDEDRLVVAVLLEAGERRVGRRVQVRRQRADGLPAVALDLWGWGGCG